MANQAAKKAAKAGAKKGGELKTQMAILNVVYLVVRMILRRASVTFADWGVFALLAVLYAVAYVGQVATAGTPGAGELYFDLYVITAAAQLICCFSNYGLCLYLLIPAYGCYYLFGGLMSKKPAAKAEEDEMDEAARKKMAKKEKKAARVQYRRRM
mmetsp:Transcript_17220/g.65715  ORF Transcript_17220/g.65715 Transcript_17220/m.65715 type:complete len:156 (-) Transcript_17220:25-492(-)